MRFGTRSESEIDTGIGDNTIGKFGRGRIIEGNSDRAPQQATPEGSDPFRRVRAPQEDAIIGPNTTFFQLASAQDGHSQEFLIGPDFTAIAVLLDKSDATGEASELVKKREKVWAGHGSVGLRGPRVHHTPDGRIKVVCHLG
jgi:hypothetical protein